MENNGKKKKLIIITIIIIILIIVGILSLLKNNNIIRKYANADEQKMEQDVDLSYEIKSGNSSTAQMLIKISSTKGIKEIECSDGNIIKAESHKEQIAIDLEANIGEQYKYVITTEDGEKVEKTVNINYYSSYEICNVTPYGYDVYIYGVNDFINTVKYPTWTTANGQDDLNWYVARNIGNGTYYGRVNLHNQEAGEYITHLYFYRDGDTITTAGCTATIAQKNKNITNITADSLVAGVRDNNIPTGYCDMNVNGKTYNLEVINLDEFYKYNQEKSQYEMRDFIAGTYNISRTAVIKCNGNLQIDGSVTTSIGNIDGYNSLTKVKGLYICANGTLTNNGTISMTARGTYNTPGEDIFLWKNNDGSYETVPAVGASGGTSVTAYDRSESINGNKGTNGTSRQTGGGGSGATVKSARGTIDYGVTSGAGSKGTSYSGGSGGGGSAVRTGSSSKNSAESGYENGGPGGQGNANKGGGSSYNYSAGGGAGNPGGYSEKGQHELTERAPTGTGGLIIIYADIFDNKYCISSEGRAGGSVSSSSMYPAGGSSGGGSINIFYKDLIQKGSCSANGGYGVDGRGENYKVITSGAGGSGTITYTKVD